MYLISIVAGTASSTMESDSTSECLLDDVDKDKLSQEAATDAPASSTLHSHEDKSADTESFEAEKSGTIVEQLIEEEFQEVKVESTKDNATDVEKECDKKSEPDFQSSISDDKEPSSTVVIESSSEVKNKLSSKSSKLDSAEDLAVDMKHLVSDNNDSEITIDSSHEDETQTEPSSLEISNTVLSTSSKPNLVESTAVDGQQKTTEKNEPNSSSKEEDLSSMDVGATRSEENSNISDTQETKSGFDSADSTNDVDSFITQEAVQMAIKLMDEEEGDKKKDNLSSSNNVASSPHEESAIGVQTDCSSASKTERPLTCRNEELTDTDMKKVEQNVIDIENSCPRNEKKLDDDKHTEIDPVVAINKVEKEIGNLKIIEDDKVGTTNIKRTTAIKKVEEIMGTLKSSGDDTVEKIETKSSIIKIKKDLLKDKTKQECVKITLEEKDVNKQQLDSIITIRSHDQVSVTNEFAKKIEENVCSNKTKIQETSLSEIPNENTPLLKPLDKVECKVTNLNSYKSSTPVESISKMDTTEVTHLDLSKSSSPVESTSKMDTTEVTHLDSSKSSTPVESTSKMDTTENNVPYKNSKGDLNTNSEIYRPYGLKSNEDLQTSNQGLLETGNSCKLSKKGNENLVVKDTDSELMEVDEQILTEEESLAPNTQSLSTADENKTFKSKIENTPGDKNITTENPIVGKSSESKCRKNLESQAADLIKPDQADTADTSSTDLVAFMRSALAKNEEFRKNLSSEFNDLKEETVEECGIELICLDDDDEGVQIKRPAEAKLCVNPNCMSGVDLQKPGNFVLTYFKLKKAKNQLVCAECFNVVCKHQQVRQNE